MVYFFTIKELRFTKENLSLLSFLLSALCSYVVPHNSYPVRFFCNKKAGNNPG